MTVSKITGALRPCTFSVEELSYLFPAEPFRVSSGKSRTVENMVGTASLDLSVGMYHL